MLGALLGWCWKKRKDWARSGALWVLFFLLTFSLASNLLLPISNIMAERLLYLPSVGYCVLLSWFLLWIEKRRPHAGVALAGILIAALAARTFVQNFAWHDEKSLAQRAVQTSPQSARAHFNLANALAKEGLLDPSITEYRRATALYPEYALAYVNLCVTYANKRERDLAMASCNEAMRISPTFAKPWLEKVTHYLER